MVCELVEEVAMYRELVDAEPLLQEPIYSPGGVQISTRFILNPAERGMRYARIALASALSELGFNPTARSRLGLAEIKKETKLHELL
jgi:phage terminase small subunit